jgi:hypothetical protein
MFPLKKTTEFKGIGSKSEEEFMNGQGHDIGGLQFINIFCFLTQKLGRRRLPLCPNLCLWLMSSYPILPTPHA